MRPIRKEDDTVYPASMSYLGEQEQKTMLLEFSEADRKMIRAKYQALIEEYERLKPR